jgi:hypothetical protein
LLFLLLYAIDYGCLICSAHRTVQDQIFAYTILCAIIMANMALIIFAIKFWRRK